MFTLIDKLHELLKDVVIEDHQLWREPLIECFKKHGYDRHWQDNHDDLKIWENDLNVIRNFIIEKEKFSPPLALNTALKTSDILNCRRGKLDETSRFRLKSKH